MPAVLAPDVVVYVCHRSLPPGTVLPRQWKMDDVWVVLHEVPCSGKMDGQYLLHALEGGTRGLCVVACPKGECRLNQGNYRAEIRIRTIRRLLGEVGLEPERAELLHVAADKSPADFDQLLRDAVRRICALGASPVRLAKQITG